MTDLLIIIKNVFNGLIESFSVKFLPSIFLPIVGVLFGFESQTILRSLFILIIIDFITGIISAYVAGEVIKSRSAIRSAYKTAIYGMLVSAAHLTEQVTPFQTFIEETVVTFLALTELISILENTGKMGFAIPKKLLSKLHKLRDEDVTVKQKRTVKVTTNPKTDAVTTHTVEEKMVETHTVEKPN